MKIKILRLILFLLLISVGCMNARSNLSINRSNPILAKCAVDYDSKPLDNDQYLNIHSGWFLEREIFIYNFYLSFPLSPSYLNPHIQLILNRDKTSFCMVFNHEVLGVFAWLDLLSNTELLGPFEEVEPKSFKFSRNGKAVVFAANENDKLVGLFKYGKSRAEKLVTKESLNYKSLFFGEDRRSSIIDFKWPHLSDDGRLWMMVADGVYGSGKSLSQSIKYDAEVYLNGKPLNLCDHFGVLDSKEVRAWGIVGNKLFLAKNDGVIQIGDSVFNAIGLRGRRPWLSWLRVGSNENGTIGMMYADSSRLFAFIGGVFYRFELPRNLGIYPDTLQVLNDKQIRVRCSWDHAKDRNWLVITSPNFVYSD